MCLPAPAFPAPTVSSPYPPPHPGAGAGGGSRGSEPPDPVCTPLPGRAARQAGNRDVGPNPALGGASRFTHIPHPSHQEIGPRGPELPLLLPLWAKPGPWALQRERVEDSLAIINPGMARAEPSWPLTPRPAGTGRTLEFLEFLLSLRYPPHPGHGWDTPPQFRGVFPNFHPRMKLQGPAFSPQGSTLIPVVP